MNKGFTIIELVISIFVLSVGIVGVYSAFSVMIILTGNTSNRLIANYLAQEGVELVVNARAQNWINSSPSWLTNLSENCNNWVGCEADYTTTGVFDSYDAAYLYIDTNGFYSYNSARGKQTKFMRKIVVSCLDATGTPDASCASTDYMAKISVTVYWDQKKNILNPAGDPGLVTAEEYLYNWY